MLHTKESGIRKVRILKTENSRGRCSFRNGLIQGLNIVRTWFLSTTHFFLPRWLQNLHPRGSWNGPYSYRLTLSFLPEVTNEKHTSTPAAPTIVRYWFWLNHLLIPEPRNMMLCVPEMSQSSLWEHRKDSPPPTAYGWKVELTLDPQEEVKVLGGTNNDVQDKNLSLLSSSTCLTLWTQFMQTGGLGNS